MRLIFLFLFCPLCLAQDLTYDFGEVSKKDILKYELELKEKPKNVLLLCDCLVANVIEKKINNNSVYFLNIEFDPKDYEGNVEQDIIIYYNNNKKTKLRLKAFVKKGEI